MTSSRRRAAPSVARRLLIASLLLMTVLIPAAGVALNYNFRASVTAAFDERLLSLINTLVASVEHEAITDRLQLMRPLGDARFDRVFSGWYWQVHRDGADALSSRSLWDESLPRVAQPTPQFRDGLGPRGQRLRIVSRSVRLASLEGPLTLTVAIPRSELDAQMERFQMLLWTSLIGLGVLLLGGLAIQIRWGLAPLRHLRADIQRVRNGETDSVGTDLPRELSELARAMNAVLERDRARVERGRTAAGNLAHALKTPLTVLRTLSESLPGDAQKGIRLELDRLDAAIRHHLARAAAAGGQGINPRVSVQRTLAPVVDGLAQLANRRGLQLQAHIPEVLRVQVDAQDLQEIIGNLLENAVKWAKSTVDFRVSAMQDGICFEVCDDGPGIPEPTRDMALQRGMRLDERLPGSGLGLAIVEELVALYQGRFQLDASEHGGLAAVVWLPDHPLPQPADRHGHTKGV